MAKFCTKCGGKLEEGKCPKCSEENVATEVITSEDVKEHLNGVLGVIKGIFTKPISTIKDNKSEKNYVVGIILIVCTAILTGIYKIATIKNAYDVTVKNIKINSVLPSVETNYLKSFMTEFAYNLVEYGLIVVIAYFVISKLSKNKVEFKEIVNIVGMSLAVVLVANLVNSILVFIDGEAITYIRGYIFTFAEAFKYLVLYEGIKEISKVDKERLFINVSMIFIGATIVIDIFQKIFN